MLKAKHLKLDTKHLGSRVEVYKNLRNGLYSIRSLKTKRVIGHASSVFITKATFRVSKAGRTKVLETRQKNVHAFVRGILSDFNVIRDHSEKPIRYNPYLFETFVLAYDSTAIFTSDYCYLGMDNRLSIS